MNGVIASIIYGYLIMLAVIVFGSIAAWLCVEAYRATCRRNRKVTRAQIARRQARRIRDGIVADVAWIERAK
jgi:hypothetical protein